MNMSEVEYLMPVAPGRVRPLVHHLEAQRLFYEAWDGVRRQGRPGMDKFGACHYFEQRTGLRCAVGMLIGSDEYDSAAEGLPAAAAYAHLPARLRGHLSLLQRIQKAHDSACESASYFFMQEFDKQMGVIECSLDFSRSDYRCCGGPP